MGLGCGVFSTRCMQMALRGPCVGFVAMSRCTFILSLNAIFFMPDICVMASESNHMMNMHVL
jgi:hypothetical protein